MKLQILVTICIAFLGSVLGVNPKDPRNIGISITGTLDTNDRQPGLIGGGVVGPSRGYPSGNNNQGRYPGGNQGSYPGGNHGSYPGGNQGNYPGGDRDRYLDDNDRYPVGGNQGNRPSHGGDRYPVGGNQGNRPSHGGDRYPDSDRYPAEYDYVTFYQQPYFKGWSFNAPLSNKCRNLENDYNNYNNGISSIKTHGNCVVVYTRYDCRGREFIIRPRYENNRPGQGQGHGSNYRPNYLGHSELAEDLNNSISSYRRC